MRYLVAALASLTLAPSMAHAGAYDPDGFATCQVYQSDRNRVLYSHPFPAFEADTDSMYGDFLVQLKSDGYISDMAAVTGACNWETTADAAADMTEGFKSHYSDNGASTMGVDFTYTPETDTP